MKKWLYIILIVFVSSVLGFSVFILKSSPAQAGVSVSVTVSICGNSTIDSGAEQCDNGGSNGACPATCSASCTTNSGGGSGSPGGGGGGGSAAPTTKVVLQGKAYPLAPIAVLIDGKTSAVIKADSGANFKIEFPIVNSGIYTFSLWAEDKEGRRSITLSFTVTIGYGMTTTISNIFLPPTIELEKFNVLPGELLDISGQTSPESEMTISVQSPQEITQKTRASGLGDWQYSLNTVDLEEGSHATRVNAKDPSGLVSAFSKVLGFYVGKYSASQVCLQADFNKDGKTSLIDFSIMLFWWGKSNPCVDQNQDGVVNLPDFSILMYYWTG